MLAPTATRHNPIDTPAANICFQLYFATLERESPIARTAIETTNKLANPFPLFDSLLVSAMKAINEPMIPTSATPALANSSHSSFAKLLATAAKIATAAETRISPPKPFFLLDSLLVSAINIMNKVIIPAIPVPALANSSHFI